MSPCQACGKPADYDQVPGLCRQCAATIDEATDELLERQM
jgi:NMD protein affecting ribosome stability and mRNA decay